MAHPFAASAALDLASIMADTGRACDWTAYGQAAASVTAAVGPFGPDLAGAPAQVAELYGYHQGGWIVAVVLTSAIGTPARDADTLTVDGAAYTVRWAEPVFFGAGWRLWCSADEGRGR